MYVEALEPYSIDRVLILFRQSTHGLPIDSSVLVNTRFWRFYRFLENVMVDDTRSGVFAASLR